MLLVKKNRLLIGNDLFYQKYETVITTTLFWECLCNKGYVHPYYVDDCHRCRLTAEEGQLATWDNIRNQQCAVDPIFTLLAKDALRRWEKEVTPNVNQEIVLDALRSRWFVMRLPENDLAKARLVSLSKELTYGTDFLHFPWDHEIQAYVREGVTPWMSQT